MTAEQFLVLQADLLQVYAPLIGLAATLFIVAVFTIAILIVTLIVTRDMWSRVAP